MTTTRLAIFVLVWTVACGGARQKESTSASNPTRKVVLQGSSLLIVEGSDDLVPVEIQFALDSDVLEEEGKEVLDLLTAFLRTNPELGSIEIQGHSDERGSAQYNLDLSARRAEVVKQYLVSQGIEGSRLRARGYGDSRPAASGEGEVAWSQNRRVEFILLDLGTDGD